LVFKNEDEDEKFARSKKVQSPAYFYHEEASLYRLERPNHLRDLWDKLRIPLLQLWISPKIMP
jgi:hypothetical protein